MQAKVVGVMVMGAMLLAGCARSRLEKSAPPAPAAPAAPSASVAKPTSDASRANEELILTSLPSIPGRTIAEQKGGFYCQFFQYSGTGDYAERFRRALESIREAGKSAGANAFVHASVSSESHEIQGSKWHSSFVHICGDFVHLE